MAGLVDYILFYAEVSGTLNLIQAAAIKKRAAEIQKRLVKPKVAMREAPPRDPMK